MADIRRCDAERFQLEIVGGGLAAGAGLLIGNKMKPTPLGLSSEAHGYGQDDADTGQCRRRSRRRVGAPFRTIVFDDAGN